MSNNKMRLSQHLATEKGAKAAFLDAATELRNAGKSNQWKGSLRQYKPLDEEDPEKLPDEDKTAGLLNADAEIAKVLRLAADAFDAEATKDYANTIAWADVVLQGKVIIEAAPVPLLLYLEKALTDLNTMVEALPTLSRSERWAPQGEAGLYVSQTVQTLRTKKMPRPVTLAPATEKHPAQVQLINEDMPVGNFFTTQWSGALPLDRKNTILARIATLKDAVKQAREEANATRVEAKKISKEMLDFILDD